MIVEYVDNDEPITVAEAKKQCAVDHDEDDLFFSDVIIPGARAMAEAKTGSAIRKARFTETLPDMAASSLAMGSVVEVESVAVGGVAVVDYTQTMQARRTVISAPVYADKSGVVTYTAGVDIALYPSVKNWMLLAVGWLYANRELLVIGNSGQVIAEMPKSYIDVLLAPIDVPSPF